MLINLGYCALALALVCAFYAAVMALLSAGYQKPHWLASARRAALLTWPLITLSAICLIGLMLTDHYEVEYVAGVTNRAMPGYLKITALWGGQSGSLLFWSWLMAGFAGAVMLRKWDRDRALMPYVTAVTMITVGFFVSLVVFIENPFARLWQTLNGEVAIAFFQPAGTLPLVPMDGNGLSPLLRHPGMIFHPPLLYLGFVSFVIPFAFAMAALITRRTDDAWIRTTRRWTLIGWLFLSMGLLLGGRWAYDVLGWGGYWGWDPVENAALIPWLTATAFLHSVIIQEKRGMLKKWNMVLIILTYLLVIYGTLLTRSGVLSSVHAFAQSAIGPWFLAFIGATALVSLAFFFREWNNLRDERQFDSLFSRETAFLVNNLLLLSIAATVFLGTNYPMLSELVTGTKISVGPPFYNQVTGPQFAALLLLTGIAPLMAWRNTSPRQLWRLTQIPVAVATVLAVVFWFLGAQNWLALIALWIVVFVVAATGLEYWRGTRARMRLSQESPWTALTTLMARNRRRYGGYIIHLGKMVMAVGIIGSNFFQLQTQGHVLPGEQITLGRYVLLYRGLSAEPGEDSLKVYATIEIYRDGRLLDKVLPHHDQFTNGEVMTIPGVRSSVEDDVYVILAEADDTTSAATFKVYVNPLINWLWAGGLLFILGMLVAAWPEKER